MKKAIVLLPLVALLVTGCTSGGRKGGKQGDSTPIHSDDDPEGFEYYTYRYRNKKDCFGNDVEDYYFYEAYGEDLADQVHNYCVDSHKTFLNYYTANYYNIFAETDKYFDENGNEHKGKISLFYTGKEVSRGSGNREHVWPCANSNTFWQRNSSGNNPYYQHQIDNNHDYWGGGSDIYNLHACDGNVNSIRKNAKFINFSSTTGYTVANDGGPYNLIVNPAQTFAEPAKEYRGNVARIIMYMWCHYSFRGDRNIYYPKNYASLKPVYDINEAVKQDATNDPNMCCATLSLNLIVGYVSRKDCYEALKRWNEEDPPDAQEKYANDYIEAKVQGNRNPFVDYPQLVGRIVDYLE